MTAFHSALRASHDGSRRRIAGQFDFISRNAYITAFGLDGTRAVHLELLRHELDAIGASQMDMRLAADGRRLGFRYHFFKTRAHCRGIEEMQVRRRVDIGIAIAAAQIDMTEPIRYGRILIVAGKPFRLDIEGTGAMILDGIIADIQRDAFCLLRNRQLALARQLGIASDIELPR